jgi:hypothetical protein
MRKNSGFALAAALTLAATLPMISIGYTAPVGVALVESFTGTPAGVAAMDYLESGRTVWLRPHETIVLSYLNSCVRETITGGSVTIGTDQSEVKAGEVKRTRLKCDTGSFVLMGRSEAAVAGRTFRGINLQASEARAGR